MALAEVCTLRVILVIIIVIIIIIIIIIIKAPLHNSRVNWIYDPTPPPPRHAAVHSRVSIPSHQRKKEVSTHSHSVPRIINNENTKTTQVSDNAKRSSPPSKKRRYRKHRIERRARERENRSDSFIHDARWANQRTAVPGSPVVPERMTQSLPEAVDPISPMRTAVYPPSRIVGNPSTNDNSPFQIGLESSRIPGLYKPADPDQQQDTWAYDFEANSSGIGPPSPTRTFEARSSGSGPRAGIVYPLQPRRRRPDVCITVDAALPEPAAFQRQTQPPTVVDIGSPVKHKRASRRPCRKRRRNRSAAVFRPAKHSPPRGHWCD